MSTVFRSHAPTIAPRLLPPQEKQAYVAETRGQQEGALLQVLSRFVGVLSAGHGSAEGEAMHAGGAGVGA